MPLKVEGLESRALLTAWVEQGPAPIINAQSSVPKVPNVGSNPVVGAIESVATDPSNANIIYVGTVNGGIWKTTNGTDPNPTWTPLTDHLPSLAIADIKFSPLDPTHQTLYAATGQYTAGGLGPLAVFSNQAGLQGSASGAGIYKTTDGGTTWTQLGAADFDGLRLRDVVPTSLTVNGSQVVLTDVRDPGPNSGIWRSTDGGASWTRISGTDGLPTGGVSEMIADPSDPTGKRFYAAIPALSPLGNSGILSDNSSSPGIYRSDDGGLTWQPVDMGLVLPYDPTSSVLPFSARIEMTIGKDQAGDNVIYAAVLTQSAVAHPPAPGVAPKQGFDVAGIYRALDLPQNQIQNFQWRSISPFPNLDLADFEPGEQGKIHFAMEADPNVPNVIYIAGDRQPDNGNPPPNQWPNDVGATDYTGRSFRITVDNQGNIIGNPQPTDWNGATGTSAHADSRHMVFDANGNILEVDDGGIYRLSNPDSPSRIWSSVNGNLRDTEVYSVAYDDLNHTIIAGTQDNGSAQQTSRNGQIWNEVRKGDGGVTATDNTSTPGVSFHYFASPFSFNQNTGVYEGLIFYEEFDSNGHNVPLPLNNPLNFQFPDGTFAHRVALTVTNVGNQFLGSIAPLQFTQSYKLDHVDPTRFMIGTGAPSIGPGGQFTFSGGHIFDSPPTATPGTSDRGDTLVHELDNVGTNYMVTGYDYGGLFQGVANPDIAYVGFQTGPNTGGVLLRTTAGGTFMTLPGYTAAGGTVPRAIVMDPKDDQHAFSIDENGHIYETLDQGNTWVDITGNVGSLTDPSNLRTIDVISPTGSLSDETVLVGGQGGVFELRNLGLAGTPTWSPLGTGLSNAIVTDLHYDPLDNVVVIGTYGRGVWTLSLAPTVLAVQRFGVHAQPTTLVLTFDASLDPARAQDVTNYRIAPVGVHGRVGHPIRVRAAVYDPAAQTVTLSPARQLPLHQAFQLTVNGMAPRGLASTEGVLLAGAGNGVPGSNFVRVIDRSTLAGPAPTHLFRTRQAIKTAFSGVQVAGRSTLARQAPINLGRSQRAIKTGSSGGVSASAVDALATSGKLLADRHGPGHRAGRSAGLA